MALDMDLAKRLKTYRTFKNLTQKEVAAHLNVPHSAISDIENGKRQQIAKRYCTEIKNDKFILPVYPIEKNENVWHLFVIRSENRTNLQEYLSNNGVQTLIHYPIPPHKQSAYKEYNHMSFPLTEKLHDTVLSIPISPVLTETEVTHIIKVLNNY